MWDKARNIFLNRGNKNWLFLFFIVALFLLAIGAFFLQEEKAQDGRQNGVPIAAQFGGKIVYTTDQSADVSALQAHCADAGGVFNECGTTCAPDAQLCASMCAFTCEFSERGGEEITTENVRVEAPRAGAIITSPLEVTGEARGTWFFEASFPLVLVEWDGRIIAESYATAKNDPTENDGAGWMTEDFVPFSGTLEFDAPYEGGVAAPDFMRRGTLILQKDNPSGLPEHDDAVEVPILFE